MQLTDLGEPVSGRFVPGSDRILLAFGTGGETSARSCTSWRGGRVLYRSCSWSSREFLHAVPQAPHPRLLPCVRVQPALRVRSRRLSPPSRDRPGAVRVGPRRLLRGRLVLGRPTGRWLGVLQAPHRQHWGPRFPSRRPRRGRLSRSSRPTSTTRCRGAPDSANDSVSSPVPDEQRPRHGGDRALRDRHTQSGAT